MTNLNISIPESMRVFIEEQAAKGGYSTASEYIHHLIRQEQNRLAQTQVEELLIEGLDSGEPIEVTDEWWEQKRTQLVEHQESVAALKLQTHVYKACESGQ